MEIALIVIAVIVIVVFMVAIMSGPSSDAKVVDQLHMLDDSSLINEFNRVHRWLERYNSLDADWKAKAATREVHQKYERYYKDICHERNRRYFFQGLKEHVPELKMLSITSYGDALNDSMTNIAWQMKCSGQPMGEIIAWYRKEIGGYEDPHEGESAGTITDEGASSERSSGSKRPTIDVEVVDDHMSNHLTDQEKEDLRKAALQSIDQPEHDYVPSESANIVAAITRHINYQIILREDPSDMDLGIKDIGIPKDVYVRETFVGNLAFAFYRITERSIFSGSSDERRAFFDTLLSSIKEGQPYEQRELFSGFSELSESIRGLGQDEAENMVIAHVKRALSITGPENEEIVERLYGRLQLQVLKWSMIEDAFLRAGYWELYKA